MTALLGDGLVNVEFGSTVHTIMQLSHPTAISEAELGLHAAKETPFCELHFKTGTELGSEPKILTLSSAVTTATLEACGCHAMNLTAEPLQSLVLEYCEVSSEGV